MLQILHSIKRALLAPKPRNPQPTQTTVQDLCPATYTCRVYALTPGQTRQVQESYKMARAVGCTHLLALNRARSLALQYKCGNDLESANREVAHHAV